MLLARRLGGREPLRRGRRRRCGILDGNRDLAARSPITGARQINLKAAAQMRLRRVRHAQRERRRGSIHLDGLDVQLGGVQPQSAHILCNDLDIVDGLGDELVRLEIDHGVPREVGDAGLVRVGEGGRIAGHVAERVGLFCAAAVGGENLLRRFQRYPKCKMIPQ